MNFRFSSLQTSDQQNDVREKDLDEGLDVLRMMRMGLEKRDAIGKVSVRCFLNCNYKLFHWI